MGSSDVVRAYIGAVERFDVATVASLLDAAMVQRELPNLLYASGQVRSRAAMLEDLPKGQRVLRSQRYDILSVIEQGDHVAVEARWEGVLAIPLGRLSTGDPIVAHIAMLFEVRQGRIVSQRNYDCYEAFR